VPSAECQVLNNCNCEAHQDVGRGAVLSLAPSPARGAWCPRWCFGCSPRRRTSCRC